MTLPTDELGWASCASRETTLKDARGVEPGCVEIMPRKRVTFHVRTWLYSEQMETRFFSLSMTFTTGFRWTMNVWKSCGPWPTVSGCWTITRTVPELVPYAISIQLPLKPDKKNKTVEINLCQEKRLFLRIRISRDRLWMEHKGTRGLMCWNRSQINIVFIVRFEFYSTLALFQLETKEIIDTQAGF